MSCFSSCLFVAEKEQEQPIKTIKSTESPAQSSAECEDRTDAQRTHGNIFSSNTYSGFPLLPFPPHEEAHQKNVLFQSSFKSHSLPTEDRMGSLHNFIPEPSGPMSLECKERKMTQKQKDPLTSVPRFVPRTTHLENRKRKMEDSTDLLGVANKNAPLYGPKLPEPPKMDMEDDSLNKTANIIRQTLAKVSCFIA